MSLESYRLSKVVVLGPMATVREAARAMARHRIGAVLVGEHGAVTGIVTDRDLALFVVGDAADCKRTTVEQVMSEAVVSIDVTGTIAGVVNAMQRRACRRIPITERGKVVGIVTLDDLIAKGAIELADAASVVKAELELPTAFGERDVELDVLEHEQRARLRHERRAESTLLRMVNAAQERSGLATRKRAATALGIVLGAVKGRLTRVVAEHFLAQMPLYVRRLLERREPGPDRAINAAWVIGQLMAALDLDATGAERALTAIGEVVAESISRGEVLSLRAHLPSDLKEIFPGEQRTS